MKVSLGIEMFLKFSSNVTCGNMEPKTTSLGTKASIIILWISMVLRANWNYRDIVPIHIMVPAI